MSEHEHELGHAPEPIRVVIVEDHPAVRACLTAMLLLADDIEVVGVAATGEEALRLYVETRPNPLAARAHHRLGAQATRALSKDDERLASTEEPSFISWGSGFFSLAWLQPRRDGFSNTY
jgi:hypothetical protein